MIVALDDWFPVGFEANASSNVAQFNQSTNTSGPRIFCIILSSEKNFLTRAESVYKTWAPRCDMFKFVLKVPSDLAGVKTKPGLDEILQPDGLVEDRYEKLTDKMLLTFKHLYNSPEYNNYDWYLKADDDTFIFVDNLRAFLADKNSSQPVTYGYDFKMFVEGGYHSGGGSYLLSNEALTRIGRQVSQNFSFCNNTGIEDIDVALCLRRLQVYPNKSIDELNRERFHPLSIQHHYREYFPEWLYAYASNPVKSGIECCSDSTISKPV